MKVRRNPARIRTWKGEHMPNEKDVGTTELPKPDAPVPPAEDKPEEPEEPETEPEEVPEGRVGPAGVM